MNIFVELSAILAITTLISAVMRFFRQPLIVAYILSGIIVGPFILNVLHEIAYIELFSKIGITILLFIVGIGLNPLVIREIGKTAFLTGVGQIIFTSIIGFFIVKALGFGNVVAVYTSIALTLSSTIIVLKLLSDKGDTEKLYGRISIGFLLIQDVFATVALVVISSLSTSNDASVIVIIGTLLIKGAIAAVVVYIVSKFILPYVSRFFASTQELLFLFSIAWGLGLATLFYMLGFSIEIGALIAGISLSVSPFAYEISSRMKPLRDFFVILFFVLLGSQVVVSDLSTLFYPAIILSIFVLVGNPIIVFVIMNILGYRRKVSFMAGLTVAQVSEFSLILAALALSVGHISQETVSLITLVGIVTIAGSTYLIMHAEGIYRLFERYIKYIEIRKAAGHTKSPTVEKSDIIIFGYDRVGDDFVKAAERLGRNYIVVDFNPNSIKRMEEMRIPHRYGDAEDAEFLQELDLHDVRLVVSTIPDFNATMVLLNSYRKENPSGIIIVLSHDIEHAKKLYLAGASYVVMPHYLGAHHAAQMISRFGFNTSDFDRERNLHLQRLSKRELVTM